MVSFFRELVWDVGNSRNLAVRQLPSVAWRNRRGHLAVFKVFNIFSPRLSDGHAPRARSASDLAGRAARIYCRLLSLGIAVSWVCRAGLASETVTAN